MRSADLGVPARRAGVRTAALPAGSRRRVPVPGRAFRPAALPRGWSVSAPPAWWRQTPGVDHAVVQHVRAHRPELLAEADAELNETVARHQTVAHVAAQHFFGVRAPVGADRDAIPAPAKGKSVHVFQCGSIGARAVGGDGQAWLSLDLDPDDLVRGLGQHGAGYGRGKDQGRGAKARTRRIIVGRTFTESKSGADKQETATNAMAYGPDLVTMAQLTRCGDSRR